MKLTGVFQNLPAFVIVLGLTSITTLGAPIVTYPSSDLEARALAYSAQLCKRLKIDVTKISTGAKAFTDYMAGAQGKALLKNKIPIVYTGADSLALREGKKPTLNFDPTTSPPRYIHQDLTAYKNTFRKSQPGADFITISDVENASGVNTEGFSFTDWAYASIKFVEANLEVAEAAHIPAKFKLAFGDKANPSSLFTLAELPLILHGGAQPAKIEAYVCTANMMCGEAINLDMESLKSEID